MMPSRIALGAGLLAVALAAGAQTAPRKTYIVQLADAPAASYTGTISGLSATRPAAGAKLDVSTRSVKSYRSYLDTQRASVLAAVGGAPVVHKYDIAFNGFAAQLTEAQARKLKTSAAVLTVNEAPVVQLDTTRTPAFLGLSTPGGLWSKLDSRSRLVKGEDVIIGMIDSGAWPEDSSFGDKVDANGKPVAYNQAGTLVYGAAPTKWRGTCTVGEGFTAAMCNNKLLGGRYYVDGWLAGGNTLHPHEFKSPRDGGGHGTHTASTAGGNEGAPAIVGGAPAGTMSGMAPRARLAIYKVCWDGPTRSTADSGCGGADILKAIDDAVADGVDVINYSISGSQTSFTDSVETAYLNAAAAGVFVAASAGNSGPANQVAHISPWLTTVAASTHDRQPVADLRLGNGQVYTGASVISTAIPSASIILASAIPAAGQAVVDAQRCFANSLDPAGAAGKIVVCDRGVNDRVAKSAEVRRAGGVAMVLLNPTSNTVVADFHTLPTVHLQDTAYTPVRTYAATAGATATISASYQQPGVIAPVMASFSSRGPNKGNGNILKPDISGPGVDIIAGYIDAGISDAQYAALLNGSYTPNQVSASLQGTSMSSPHVAGVAALFKQLFPTWTPSAIKSALMTGASDILLASGAVDTDRWGYGAGHLNPNNSANPGLVYDASPADYGRFLCGLGLTPPAGIGSCTALGSIQPWNLNLASMTASDVAGSLTFNRRVTNVGTATATYLSSFTMPGWNVTVSPSSLTLAAGASASFTVTVARTTAAVGSWTFGNLVWSDGVRTVRSPLSAKPVLLSTPAQLNYTSANGPSSRSFPIVSGFDGALRVKAIGLVPATRSAGSVVTNAVQCFNVVVPAGAAYARFQTFNADTQGGASTDLDLNVYNGPGGTGTLVGSSGAGDSEEVVSLTAPAAGTYSACVVGYLTPAGGAAFTLSSWVIGPAVGTQTLVATGPRSVTAGADTPIQMRWTVPAGPRYLGQVSFLDPQGASAGSTMVYVDTSVADQPARTAAVK